MTMELDILKILKNEGPCRPCEIREKLKEKSEYKSYALTHGNDRVLDVLIQRALVKLGDRVQRQYRGRQQVFYSLRKEARVKVEEELYKHDNISDISKDDLHQAKIPRETIDRAWSAFEDALYAKAIKKAGLLDMAQTITKFARGEWQFFKEIDVEERVRQFSEAFDIGLSYPKGEIPPQIPEWAYWMLLHITSASQGFPPHVEKFKIILNFDSTRTKKQERFDEKAFAQWLERFKKQTVKPDILEYLKTEASSREERMRPESVNPDELAKFEEYLIEFSKKEASYLRIMTQLFERLLKEDPSLFQKYVADKRFRS